MFGAKCASHRPGEYSGAVENRACFIIFPMRVATDIGGTFTDLVCFDPRGIKTLKVPTTPPDFERGVLDAVKKSSLGPRGFSFFAHGTTVVINALLSRRGAKTALITTRGFRDVLEIARGNRPDLFNFAFSKPAPFVPRYLRHEISERMDYLGNVLEPVRLDELAPIIDNLRADGVEAIAVCLLHAYVNPQHEMQVVDEINRLWPGADVIASNAVCREWREYERTSTTVLSAYVLPVAKRYLQRLEAGVAGLGLETRVSIMQSNGGMSTVAGAAGNPVSMVESGPAGGVLGAIALGQQIGEEDLVVLDIGGTTAKTALVHGGKAGITTEYRIEWDRENPGYPVRTPVIELVEIGNGGGSIAWVDAGGRLNVGPQSAGALPGPAAYGLGGEDVTTTDANLLLGRINPRMFSGGGQEPDMDALRRAFDKLRKRLGGSHEEIARGVIRIANANMINALKLVSLNKGFDPRDFSLVAFGGGGAMHAVELGEELKVQKVIIPACSSVFSAWGMLTTDLRRDFLQTRVTRLGDVDAGLVNETYRAIEEESMAQCVAEGMDTGAVRILRFADMRYRGQEHTVKIEFPAGIVDAASLESAIAGFHTQHEREYTFRLDNEVELVNYHVAFISEIEKQPLAEKAVTGRRIEDCRKGERKVDFDEHGVHPAKIYDMGLLEPGMSLIGPAIVEEPVTTLVVTPDRVVSMDKFGNLHIDLENQP